MDLLFFLIAILLIAFGVAALMSALKKPPRPEPRPTTNAEWAALRRGQTPRTPPSRRASTAASGLSLLVLGLIVLFVDSYTTVGARSVAVQTAFGRIQGNPLNAGWHWVSPWHHIDKFDASVQTLKFYKDEPKDDGNCITVRLANNTLACVDVTAQWNINHEGDINGLYLQYKTFDNIHDNLVKRQLGSALNEVFGTYDPLAQVSDGPGTPVANTKQLQDQVRADLIRDLGGYIQIPSVTIPVIHFDGDTENRLKAYQQSKADTRIAAQQTLTAQQQALAAKELANQNALKDPGVQYQNCLNLTKDLAQMNQLANLPPTFNCSNGGTTSPVIIQSK